MGGCSLATDENVRDLRRWLDHDSLDWGATAPVFLLQPRYVHRSNIIEDGEPRLRCTLDRTLENTPNGLVRHSIAASERTQTLASGIALVESIAEAMT